MGRKIIDSSTNELRMYDVCKGDLVIVTTGQYSDYALHYMAKALISFNAASVRAEYLKTRKSEEKKYYFSDYDFVNFLLAEKYLTPVKCTEICIHGYGEGLIDLEVYDG